MSEISGPGLEVVTVDAKVEGGDETPIPIEQLTKEQALAEAVDTIIELHNLLNSASSERYGVAATLQELISVHKLTADEVLGGAFVKDNSIRQARDKNSQTTLLANLGIQFGPAKPQG